MAACSLRRSHDLYPAFGLATRFKLRLQVIHLQRHEVTAVESDLKYPPAGLGKSHGHAAREKILV